MNAVERSFDRAFQVMITIAVVSVLLITAFSLVRVAGFVPVDSSIVSINNTPDYAMGGIQGETVLQQTFKAKWPVEKIAIKMATYDRENPGEIYLRVYEKVSGITISQSVMRAEDVVDNDFNIFTLDQEIPGNNQVYVIEVSGSASNRLQSVGVWCSYGDTYPDGELTVNEFVTDGDMVFFLANSEKKSSSKAIWATIGLTAVLLLLTFAWLTWTSYENRRQS
ncbi:MAG: hypothetical protein EOM70_08435 [Clostridia bacterium]|nr:hypothetical protein [Clostridia bacterium]